MADNPSQGRYTAQGEIARGGMGVVLRVRDRNLDRTLAMKRMLTPPDQSGGEAEVARYARFLEEAQVTAHLDHPSIVPIHELGTDEEERTYSTMRLVPTRPTSSSPSRRARVASFIVCASRSATAARAIQGISTVATTAR